MTLIFVEQLTKRLTYTFDFVFNARGLRYEFTSDLTYFNNSTQQKFNYSTHSIPDVPTLVPCSLLFNEEIHQISLDKVSMDDLEFMSFNECPDLVASIFFVLSRYEEYWKVERDEHDRFPALFSIQSIFGWLDEPICDRWALGLLKFIGITSVPSSEFKIQPTVDIDSTFAYKGKGAYRTIAGILKDLSKGRINRVKDRIQVLIQKRKDPFDTFDHISRIAHKYPETRCFWLLADFGAFNKNLSYTNPKQGEIITKLASTCEIGIHPGYDTYTNGTNLALEIDRLTALTKKEIKTSRQHFLRLSIPETYINLIEQHIQIDYTMGYAETTGFRMGTARQTPWFNLKTNEITSLHLQPFCYMDGTLNEYMKLSPIQAIEEVTTLKALVKKYGGTFSFIWHNETMGFEHHWKGWEPVFEESISYS
jgi:hypothetical protein